MVGYLNPSLRCLWVCSEILIGIALRAFVFDVIYLWGYQVKIEKIGNFLLFFQYGVDVQVLVQELTSAQVLERIPSDTKISVLFVPMWKCGPQKF